MSKPIISVVVPIYNQQRYLRKCVNSVLKQSFTDTEVILVNDGSTDRSLQICKEMAARDSRIVIVDKPNGGLPSARRAGFLKAQGEYVCFLDSDDWMPKEALARLYAMACEHDADLVAANFIQVFDNARLLKRGLRHFSISGQLLTGDRLHELMLSILPSFEYYWAIVAWGRLYRCSVIQQALDDGKDKVLFPDYVACEDQQFNLILMPYLRAVWVSDEPLYYYRYGGITSRYMPFIKSGGDYFNHRLEACEKYGYPQALSAVYEHYIRFLTLDLVQQLHLNVNSEEEMRKMIQREMDNRPIVAWARQHPDQLLASSALSTAMLQCNVDDAMEAVRTQMRGRGKLYMANRVINAYRKVADVILR